MTTEPVKFSFSKAASNAGSKRKPQEEEEAKDFIKGISEDGELISVEPQKKSGGPRSIPLELQGQTKRSKPTTTIKTEDTTSSKDTTTTTVIKKEEPDVIVLDAPEKTLDEIAAEELIREAQNAAKPTEANGRLVPLTVQNQIAGIENITDETERFKYDLESRPDEADEDAYEDMPIDEFGAAMLRGMGWVPGQAIGLNNKGLVEPIEFVKRPGYRLGLGATPKDIPVKKKKYIKPGESREPPPIMVAPTGPDGKVRHVKGISEKLVPLKKGLRAGDLVGIVSGPHEGLYARVVSEGSAEDDDIVVRLEASSEDVVVSKSDVSVVDLSKLSEGHPALKFMSKNKDKAREIDEPDDKDSHKKDKDRKESSSKHSSSKKSSSSRDDHSPKKTWITPRIMVRIVSKSFQNGKYYNKKVRILDVVGHDKCTIQLDNGSLVEGVKQRMLETVIPPAGGKIMVVEGGNKGRLGTLLERKKHGDTESAIVQMMGDLSIETYPLDDVAQYVGTFEEEAVDIL